MIRFTMNVHLIAACCILLIPLGTAEKVYKSILEGNAVEFLCSSSHPPAWLWQGKGPVKPLAHGVTPYPTFNEPRYTFSKARGNGGIYTMIYTFESFYKLSHN